MVSWTTHVLFFPLLHMGRFRSNVFRLNTLINLTDFASIKYAFNFSINRIRGPIVGIAEHLLDLVNRAIVDSFGQDASTGQKHRESPRPQHCRCPDVREPCRSAQWWI